jgi:hypothetical protein
MSLRTLVRTGFEHLRTPTNGVCSHTPYNPRGVRRPPPGSNPGPSSYAWAPKLRAGLGWPRWNAYAVRRRLARALCRKTPSRPLPGAATRSLNHEPPICLLR